MNDFPLGAGPCQADGCKRLDTDIRAVAIDGTHAAMARRGPSPGTSNPSDGPEAA